MNDLLCAGLLTSAILAAGCAQFSDSAPDARPVSAAASPGSLSRAEVLADLQMWQLAGMQDHGREEVQGLADDQYRASLARYFALRASPAFGELVNRLAENPHAVAIVR